LSILKQKIASVNVFFHLLTLERSTYSRPSCYSGLCRLLCWNSSDFWVVGGFNKKRPDRA